MSFSLNMASNADDTLGIDWGASGGKCYECWVISPCCGNPDLDISMCGRCCVCWTCCGICSFAKLCSYAADQECSIINHCVLPWCCPPCAAVVLRHNLRIKAGAGKPGNDGWLGDAVLGICCGPCSACQILRSVPVEAWDWLADVQATPARVKVYSEPPLVIQSMGISTGAPLLK